MSLPLSNTQYDKTLEQIMLEMRKRLQAACRCFVEEKLASGELRRVRGGYEATNDDFKVERASILRRCPSRAK